MNFELEMDVTVTVDRLTRQSVRNASYLRINTVTDFFVECRVWDNIDAGISFLYLTETTLKQKLREYEF